MQGAGIELESLTLDGALLLSVPEGTTVVVKDVAVKNKGHRIVPVPADEKDEVRGVLFCGLLHRSCVSSESASW